MRKAFLLIIRAVPTNPSMEKISLSKKLSMAISMGYSSLSLSEIHVNFLSYRYQKQCNKALRKS